MKRKLEDKFLLNGQIFLERVSICLPKTSNCVLLFDYYSIVPVLAICGMSFIHLMSASIAKCDIIWFDDCNEDMDLVAYVADFILF